MAEPLAPTQWGSHQLAWGTRTYVMGILNITPDSFSGDGLAPSGAPAAAVVAAAVARAERMVADGADLLDIGGESTRPQTAGQAPLDPAAERARVVPVIAALAERLPRHIIISVDTYKASVAAAALAAGACLVNDVTGLHGDPEMAGLVAARGVPVILMSNLRGVPRIDPLSDVTRRLAASVELALAAGIPWDHLILDPGIGFGLDASGNLAVLRRLGDLRALGRPLLVGTSRKSTIGKVLGGLPEDDRLEGTAATVALSIASGVDIVRVHDVREMVRVARMSDAIVRGVDPMSTKRENSQGGGEEGRKEEKELTTENTEGQREQGVERTAKVAANAEGRGETEGRATEDKKRRGDTIEREPRRGAKRARERDVGGEAHSFPDPSRRHSSRRRAGAGLRAGAAHALSSSVSSVLSVVSSATSPRTYQEALAWLYSFSDTERTGQFVRDREDNLPRERALLAALDNPQRAYGITHVAGSKGKGSTSSLIAAILTAAGNLTGLYTQPDLHTFRERMRVGDTLITEDEVVALMPELRRAVEMAGTAYGPYITYEVATTLAFLYFRQAGVAHAVIEVGLGGRLDATNVVEPLVAVITSISYEHMEVLGHTLTAIAGEKAGIVKPGVPTVCAARAPEAVDVIRRVCAERGAPLVLTGPERTPGAAYTFRPGRYDTRAQWLDVRTPTGVYRDLELGLLGEHQLENATAAVAAVEHLRAAGLPVDEAAIRAGLRAARWPARLQVVAERPWVVVDGAHNADSMARLLAALRRHFAPDRLVLVMGLLADKDLPGIAAEIAHARPDLVIATNSPSPRSMPPERIAAALRAAAPDLPVRAEAGAGAALAAGLASVGPRDLLCVTGTLYLAGQALRWLAVHDEVTKVAPIDIAGVDHA